MKAVAQHRLFEMPAAGLYPMPVNAANELLRLWGHKLGPCERPFHQEAFVLEVQGGPVAVAISASVVGAPVAGYGRQEVVELARQAAIPTNGWANRVMLRLWREICAPSWPCWPVRAAVSYHKNGMHSGNLYRFDGWERVREDGGSGGGGTWSKPRVAGAVLGGAKTLWVYRYQIKSEQQITPREDRGCP